MLKRFQPMPTGKRFETGVNQSAIQRQTTQPDRAMPAVQAPRSYMPAPVQAAVTHQPVRTYMPAAIPPAVPRQNPDVAGPPWVGGQPGQPTGAGPALPPGGGAGNPGNRGNSPGGGGGQNQPPSQPNVIETNPLYIQGLAALDDELNAILAAAGVEEADAKAFHTLIKSRLGIGHQEGLRRTDESTNERGIYNSGIRTRDRGYVDLDFSQRYQDNDLDLLGKVRGTANKKAEAQAKKKKGVSDLAIRIAEYLVANGVPGGAGQGNGNGGGGNGNGNGGQNNGGGNGGGQGGGGNGGYTPRPVPAIPRPGGDIRNTPGYRPGLPLQRYAPTPPTLRRAR